MSGILIRLKDINKSFGGQQVINNLELNVMDGEFLTLLGPSGCGKTTILRMIDGFEFPDSGQITLDGRDIISVPANKRLTNTVFQSYALFPHLNVRDNIGFGLRMRKLPPDEIRTRVDEALTLLRLESLALRKPSQLSGGQQQRVAIARGLVNKPRVLLLDEPLGALDLHLRRQMQLELRNFQKELGITFIYVTHDQEEAMTMSDRIAVMNRGRIEQIGSPMDIYLTPATQFVADFIGGTNFLEGSYSHSQSGGRFTCEGVSFPAKTPYEDTKKPERGAWMFSVRPEFVALSRSPVVSPSLQGTVSEQVFMGQFSRVAVALSSGRQLYAMTEGTDFPPRSKVYVSWKEEHLIAVAANQDERSLSAE